MANYVKFGATHSELNPSREEAVHFLQIWLQPNRLGVEPDYEQRHFPAAERRGRLVLLVSPDGRDGSLSSHQDALLYGTFLEDGDDLVHPLRPGRRGYVHVARGSVDVNGEALHGGDGATVEDVEKITLKAGGSAEALVFDLVQPTGTG